MNKPDFQYKTLLPKVAKDLLHDPKMLRGKAADSTAIDTKKNCRLFFLCLFLHHRSVKTPFFSNGCFVYAQSCKVIAVFLLTLCK
jgi:hypothetical protein